MSDTMRDAAWKLVPVKPTPEMIAAWGDAAPSVSVRGMPDADANRLWCVADWSAMLEAAPPPPVPATVQEIMRLMGPYISACVDCGVNNVTGRTSLQFEADVAKVDAAFKPLEAALTALVEKNHELQFSLDGVNATRPAPSMNTMQAIYAKAWMRAADWANRHDLHSDVGSPEYLKDMAIELAEFADAAMDGVNAMRRPAEQQDAIAEGTKAKKVGGSYQADGTVVAAFKTTLGDRRYVFEFDQPKGMLHIFGPSQIAVLATHGIEPEQGGNHE